MALVDPRETHWSEETQRIANKLPQYHAGRRLKTSNWSMVMNDLFGRTLHDYRDQEERAFRSLFIQTARMDEPDLVRDVFLPQGTDLTPPDVNINLLRNSSFELRSRPDKVADYWSHTGTVKVEAPSFFGETSVVLEPGPVSTASITQTISNDVWQGNTSRVFSAWYRIASWSGGVLPTNSHGIVVNVTYTDGTTNTFSQAFDTHTNDEWRRVQLTVTPSKAVATYDVVLETVRSALWNIDVPIRLDAVQVELNTSASTWRPHLSDRPHWFVSDAVAPVHFDAAAPIFVTDELRDFYYHAIPTRASFKRVRAFSVPTNRGGGIGESVDFFGDRWAFRWDIDTTNNKIRKIGINPQDIYASYDLSFFTGTDTGEKYEEDLGGVTFRCVTQFQRWLWVIHEMTGLDGNPTLCLSLADPLTPYPSPDHLESKYTLELPGLPEGIDYTRVSIQLQDPQHLYVSDGTNEYALRLYYDYAMLEPRTLRAFMREKYSPLALVR